jgi:hypothetical protein
MRRAKYGRGTPSGQTCPCATGADGRRCACADTRSAISGTTYVTPRDLTGLTTPNGRPATTKPRPDGFDDLVLVLAIAGAFVMILAVAFLVFVIAFLAGE